MNALKGKNTVALGAGIGMIAGWFFDNAGFGLVLGAAVAGVFGVIFLRDTNDSENTMAGRDCQSNGTKSNEIDNAT